MTLLAKWYEATSIVSLLWIPIGEGERSCCCCGVYWGGVTLPCGCHYCGVCEGRGHNEDHGLAGGDECGHGADSPIFVRMDHDCRGCGERHQDWERCASEMDVLRGALR